MNKTNAKDMEQIREWLNLYEIDASKLPIEYRIGEKSYKGIAKEFNPQTKSRIVNANIIERTYTGVDKETGIEIRVEVIEYKDYPVIEWTGYLTNTKEENTPIISDLYACKNTFKGTSAKLYHGNGDYYHPEGLRIDKSEIGEEELRFKPDGGRPCDKAFPYFKLQYKDMGYNLAIGWPGQWKADFSQTKEGINFSAKQEYTNFYLKAKETVRTPRITVMAYQGDYERGTNLWRRWYIEHILPRAKGEKLGPKIITHVFGGGEEFTKANEENQTQGIKKYIERGMDFDIWWIDAGWYPCKDKDGTKRWVHTGTWVPDPENFPNGLKPIGQACKDNNIEFLLWFEPERVNINYWPKDLPKEYLFRLENNDTALLNLGNKEARKWITDLVDKLIKESNIKVYRQDFNMPPLNHWLLNEEEDRRGTNENFHVQGYLKYWDDLLMKNPDLWIDSCASGGRRNDLETMRRSVPLQYTDYALGIHPIKQSYNYTMFTWLPYFRNHTWSWDDIEGNYLTDKTKVAPVDHYGYQSAMAPSITCMVTPEDDDSVFNYAIKMNKIWRQAASYMLEGDYYPLLPYSKEADSFYSVQFHIEGDEKGIIQVIRNLKCPDENITVFPKCFNKEKDYIFTSPEFNRSKTISGLDLIEKGFEVSLPIRSGEIWFYQEKYKNTEEKK